MLLIAPLRRFVLVDCIAGSPSCQALDQAIGSGFFASKCPLSDTVFPSSVFTLKASRA
jgi:hypothetical protein